MSCVTPRGKLAPGVALRLAFEVVAKHRASAGRPS